MAAPARHDMLRSATCGDRPCPSVPSRQAAAPSRPWRGRACTCTGSSASAIRGRATRSSCSTISATTIRRRTGRVSLASAPGDRDDHLCARRVGGAFRLARQPRRAGAGVGAVDDRGVGHPAPGDAAGGGVGADARLPALGEPAVGAEDDVAALPGHRRERHHRDRRRRRHGGADHHRHVLGQEGAGGRDRGGAAVPRRHGAGGGAKDAAGRYAGQRLRLRVRGRGELPRCGGTGGGAGGEGVSAARS